MDKLESKMTSLSLDESEPREILNWFINKREQLIGDIKVGDKYIYNFYNISSVKQANLKDKNCFIVNDKIKVQLKNLDSYFANNLNSFYKKLDSYLQKS